MSPVQLKMRLIFFSVLLVLGFPFTMTEVVDSFSKCSGFFFEEKPPVIKDILVESVSKDKNRYKLICHKYATLYDATNKIPVFSAYKYTGKGAFSKLNRKWKTDKEVMFLTACKEDYLNQNQWSRGHILPMSYAADVDTAKSTCKLTNIVPQKESFNSGSWSRMEQTVKTVMDSNCRDVKESNKILAYVLTGAVPSETGKMNNKVNIPSHMWTAFCCYNSKTNKWESQAHWAENIDESNNKGKTISKQSLTDVQDFLKSKYKETTPFNGKCLDLLNADVSQPLEADSDDDQQNDEERSVLAFLKAMEAKDWAAFRSFLGIGD
ncbi:nuclease-like [Carassius gibelio]|uniref:nuclease-like n=1 Tax=Carassius gibelio TaxID=101364 RepID=UPI0022791720|nr:nuclease-like [Carassius gibelio]